MGKWVIILVSIISATTAIGQNSWPLEGKLSIYETQTMASDLLRKVGKDIGYSISYDSDFLDERPITIQSEEITLRRLLDYIFDRDDLKFQIIGNQLVVYLKDNHTASDTCYKLIRGQVLDALTGDPIPKASVKSLNADLMTVTNHDGKFVLSLPCQSISSEVSILAPGYHSRLIRDLNTINLGAILMEGSYVTLQEVMILSVPVEQIVGKVLRNLQNNYMPRATNSTAFFREAILKNGKLAALSEAVFHVYNRSYFSNKNRDQAQLLKGRRFNDLIYLDSVAFKIKGSLRSCFDLDVIKNPPAFLTPSKAMDQYDYELRDIVDFDGHITYVIDFERREKVDGLPYRGTMYIDKEKFSLQSISFELDSKRLKDHDFFVVKTPKGMETRFLGSEYFVNYTAVKGRLAMNYASIKAQFKVKAGRGLRFSKFQTISEYVVNRFETEDVQKIRSRDTFISGRVFMDEPLTYDPDYWRGINYLPIDTPLTRVSDQLKHILEQ